MSGWQNGFWQPGAPRSVLLARANLYRLIRAFFAKHVVLEVATPTLARSTSTDPAIASLSVMAVDGSEECLYLQPSPEHFMKRLLANGSGDIYQITSAFRAGDVGRIHNPEFALLEWYRCGYDHHQLMAEVADLIDGCLGQAPFVFVSYHSLLQKVWQQDVLGLPPHQQLALAQQLFGLAQTDRANMLDLFYAEAITRYAAPRFFVLDFPVDQAAMAALYENKQGERRAARFECIVNGIELANGYQELTCVVQQKNRMEHEVASRKAQQLPAIAIDNRLLAALEHGLPECAGVALGLDRLLMLQLDANSLDEVLSFGADRA